jgi:glucose/arabinose dehydrogenase
MHKMLVPPAALALAALSWTAATAQEPDGLTLPAGFHAAVVADGIAGARHLAFGKGGTLFVSTRGKDVTGIVAIHLDAGHKAGTIERFSDVTGGTGIAVQDGWLYASSPTTVYRFALPADGKIPAGNPEIVVDGMPAGNFTARPIAFDARGDLYVGMGGSGNICVDKAAPKTGLNPCPDLAVRSGIWRFRAGRTGQHFPADGQQVATGIRDIDALAWRKGDALYAVVHDRNGTHGGWPDLVSAADEQAIAEEMHRVTEGANLGWPYTYYDSVRGKRLTAPEYGGDGRTEAEAGKYSTPVVAFGGHAAPLDILFYEGRQFPAAYRNGAFVVFHGGSGPDLAEGHNGYDIVFVPFDRAGKPGAPVPFAQGFAGPAASDRNASKAAYRPVGAAVGPGGALYVVDSEKGRIWRIFYDGRKS